MFNNWMITKLASMYDGERIDGFNSELCKRLVWVWYKGKEGGGVFKLLMNFYFH